MPRTGDALQQADRLSVVTQRIGYALWQLQELEGVAAHYVVLVTQVQRGMGETGNALLSAALKLPFGATLKQMMNAGLLESSLEGRFKNILNERNWLVHKSRGASRDAIHSEAAMQKVVERVDAMAEEALSLLRELGSLCERYVQDRGVSKHFIDEQANALLEQWHNSDEP